MSDFLPNESHSVWYILNVQSGFERKVVELLKDCLGRVEMSHLVDELVIPVEELSVIRRGKQKSLERVCFPGYIFCKAKMNRELWHVFKSVQYVKDFLGGKSTPRSLSDEEVRRMLSEVKETATNNKKQMKISVGDKVRIIDGSFGSFVGVVEELFDDRERLRVSVTIFGRDTPVDLAYRQVKKLD